MGKNFFQKAGDFLTDAAKGYILSGGNPAGAVAGGVGGLFKKDEKMPSYSATQGASSTLLPEQQGALSQLYPQMQSWLSSKPQLNVTPYTQSRVQVGGDKMSYQPAPMGMASSMAASPQSKSQFGQATMKKAATPSNDPDTGWSYIDGVATGVGKRNKGDTSKALTNPKNPGQFVFVPIDYTGAYDEYVALQNQQAPTDTTNQTGLLTLPDLPQLQSYTPEFGTYKERTPSESTPYGSFQAYTPKQANLERVSESRILENLNRNPADYLKALRDLGLSPLNEARDEAMQAADIEANRKGILSSSQPLGTKYGAGDSINTRYMKQVGDLENQMVLANEQLREQALQNAMGLSGRQQSREDQVAAMNEGNRQTWTNLINRQAADNEANRQFWTNYQTRQKEYEDAVRRQDWQRASDLGKWLASRDDEIAALNKNLDMTTQLKNIDLARLPLQDAQSFIYGLNPIAGRAYDASLTAARDKQSQAKEENDSIDALVNFLSSKYSDGSSNPWDEAWGKGVKG